MLMIENLLLALEGLRANKMRALLTMLGIIIGIGSVIAIVTVGDAMTASVSGAMEELGVTNLMVNLRLKDSGMRGPMMGAGGSIKEDDRISDEMIERYLEAYGDKVVAVSLTSSGGPGRAQDGRLYANVTVIGVNVGYGAANNINMASGRFLREGDIKSNRFVAVVSDKFVNNMFPSGKDPLGREIKVNLGNNLETFTVVGVYKHEQNAMMPFSNESDKDIRTNLFIPITTNNIIASIDRGYQSFIIMASSDVESRKMAGDTRSFFNTFYVNNPRYEVGVTSMESMMSTVTSMMGTLSVAVAVIAGISLVVGGVGVMNIMLVSVTERTREIGTRKALGARKSAIRIQFIVEAVIICTIGGVIGIITGIGLGYLGGCLIGTPTFPTMFIIVVAVVFSMLIGVFFGYYPANKAAKLNPIDALRYE